MADAAILKKLDLLLAADERAEARHQALMRRLEDNDEVMRAVLQTVSGLKEPLGAIREAIELLAEAADSAKPKKDVGETLQKVLKQLGELTVQTGRIANNMEALPDLVRATTLGSAEPRPGP